MDRPDAYPPQAFGPVFLCKVCNIEVDGQIRRVLGLDEPAAEREIAICGA
jgi:hypothetical protein